VPTIISSAFLELIMTVNTIYAGSLEDEVLLASVGVGSLLVNLIVFCPLFGLNGALVSLVSHAYSAGQLQLCGTLLNRARVIDTLLFAILVGLCSLSSPVLLNLGQNPSVIRNALTYSLACMPGVYCQCMFDL